MCGRIALHSDLDELRHYFRAEAAGLEAWSPSYNVAPSQDIVALRLGSDSGHPGADRDRGHRELVLLRWGLVPAWYDDPNTGGRPINARAESAHLKPTFRDAFWNRRCLVAADGFFEWRDIDGVRQPYYVRHRDGAPLGLAGLWERWRRGGRPAIESCTILTTRPNAVVEPLHDRMPVIVAPGDHDTWLNPMLADQAELARLFEPFPVEQLVAYPVSRSVNDPANDSPACIDPEAYEPPPPPLELDLFQVPPGKEDAGSGRRGGR